MRAVRERPIYSEVFERFDQFRPDPGSAYIHGESVEERSRHSATWESGSPGVLFGRVTSQQPTSFDLQVSGRAHHIQVRSAQQLQSLWARVGTRSVYIDITGLDHSTWAPLLVSALIAGLDVRAVYVEPMEYSFSRTPTEGDIFDLSERIRGVAPLPGLATLVDVYADSVFVPLLGFEGTRLAYVLEQVQPTGDSIVPIIGVPGFRPEYPFHTYLGNRAALSSTRAWHNVMYARANCPFSLWYVLADISARWPGRVLKIAPIGTKPHGLGAVLYWMTEPDSVEIVYDHPVRKSDRTAGASRTSVYHVSRVVAGALVQRTTPPVSP